MELADYAEERFSIEQRLLGAMMSGRPCTLEACDILEVPTTDGKGIWQAEQSYFSRESHRLVFRGLIGMAVTNRFPPENHAAPAELGYVLKLVGVLEKVGGHHYLMELWDSVACGSEVEHWAKRLREISRHEQYTHLAAEAAEMKGTLAGDTMAAQAAEMLRLSESSTLRPFLDFFELAGESIEQYESWKTWQDDHPGDLPGAKFGIADLDQIIGGMRPGTLTVLASPSGIGKTAFACQVALANAKQGKRVLFFSLEMPAYAIWERFSSITTGIPLEKITRRTLNIEELAKVMKVREQKFPLFVCDTAALTPTQILSRTIRASMDGELGLVVVDYVQIVSPEGPREENRERKVAGVAVALKNLAKTQNCPVFALSQLNEQKEVRESRAILHTADALIVLDRPSEGSEAEFTVRKNRQGRIGKVKARWVGERVSFHAIETKQTPAPHWASD